MKLTMDKRAKLSKSEFAEPKERKYPVENKAHAKNAKARASEMKNKGKISDATMRKIDRAANKELKKK
jgi:hypothetical protein